jgi:4-hydroxybenzoate polyprenyltransferase
MVRLGHPFPSLLDGLITAVLATVAGAATTRAALLGVAMVSLQVSIGTVNDLTDVERDRGHKPGKPLPTGLVPRRSARVLAIGSLVLGLGLSLIAGPPTVVVAIAGVLTGYAYDLRLKGTVWSWLPFAIGLPLLPVYAWVGATGRVPVAFAVLVPLGIAAGGAVALLNGLVDLDRDRAAGLATPAVRLGPRRARRIAAGLLALIALAVGGSLVAIGAGAASMAVAGLGAAFAGIGVWAVGDPSSARRERGWEAGAIGIGLLAAGWAIGFAERGRL